jgi:hypothetical protein
MTTETEIIYLENGKYKSRRFTRSDDDNMYYKAIAYAKSNNISCIVVLRKLIGIDWHLIKTYQA